MNELEPLPCRSAQTSDRDRNKSLNCRKMKRETEKWTQLSTGTVTSSQASEEGFMEEVSPALKLEDYRVADA